MNRHLAKDSMQSDAETQLPLFDVPTRVGSDRPSREYVLKLHHATRLHFDFRLEIGGVMKSWAMPVGPSVIPGVPRLAVQVPDHSIGGNAFEGVIPPGRYGAGPVMVWDRGSFAPVEDVALDSDTIGSAYEAGALSFVLRGQRLGGRWTLKRRRGQSGERSHWFLQKLPDEFSSQLFEPVDEFRTSIASGRTMTEIDARGLSAAASQHELLLADEGYRETVAEFDIIDAAPSRESLDERYQELLSQGLISPTTIRPTDLTVPRVGRAPGALKRFLDERD